MPTKMKQRKFREQGTEGVRGNSMQEDQAMQAYLWENRQLANEQMNLQLSGNIASCLGRGAPHQGRKLQRLTSGT